jgi:hypothetical protein
MKNAKVELWNADYADYTGDDVVLARGYFWDPRTAVRMKDRATAQRIAEERNLMIFRDRMIDGLPAVAGRYTEGEGDQPPLLRSVDDGCLYRIGTLPELPPIGYSNLSNMEDLNEGDLLVIARAYLEEIL